MVNWEAIALLIFGVIMCINIGLLSVDASATLSESVLGDANYVNMGFTDLNSQYADIANRTQEDAIGCTANDFLCGSLQAATATLDSLTLGIKLMMSIFIFFVNNWFAVIFGYWLALNNMANRLETGFGAIHILFTLISSAIFLIMIFSLLAFGKSLASIARGGGG